jgi:hypothetical protein
MKFNIIFYSTVLAVALVLVFLTSCGKVNCSHVIERPRIVQFGPLETISCPFGEVLGKVTPVYEPGGKLLHLNAECGLSKTECK